MNRRCRCCPNTALGWPARRAVPAYRSLKEGAAFEALSVPQRKAVDNALRDFELSGIGLSADKQQRYGEIVARLSELGSTYSNNVLDATMGWSKLITDEAELSGLPESARRRHRRWRRPKSRTAGC